MDRDCANITQIRGQKQADLRDHRRDPVVCAQHRGRQAPPRLPAAILERRSAEVVKAGGLRSRPSAPGLQGLVPSTSTPAEISTYIDKETTNYERVVKAAKIQID